MAKKTIYKNLKLIDGASADMTVVEGKKIVVENGVIVDILDIDSRVKGKEIDLEGAYLLPGLINLHSHLPASGKPMSYGSGLSGALSILKKMTAGKAVMRSLTYSNAVAELYGGCTTVRTVGGLIDCDSVIRDQINRGKKQGPRLLVANEAIAPENGHMVGTVAVACKTVDEVVAKVKEVAKQKPDLIKLMITGGVLDAKDGGEPTLRMSPEFVKAACDEAHRQGFKVAAHVESTEGVRVALENGVDTVEHGGVLTDELIELFKERDAALICTISPAAPFVYYGKELYTNPNAIASGNIVFAGIVKAAKAAKENGIKVGLGNDTGCPYVNHYEFWRELCWYKRFVETTNGEAIYAATLGNAIIAGIEKETGSIEVGKAADFIVVKKNPLEDLEALRHPYMVCARGNLVKEPPYNVPDNIQDYLDRAQYAPLPYDIDLSV